jgi:hypothetical protein
VPADLYAAQQRPPGTVARPNSAIPAPIHPDMDERMASGRFSLTKPFW